MLSGSAFLRVVVLLVVAAGLAGIIQLYWSPAPVETDPEPVVITAEPSRPVRRAEPVPAPVQPSPAPVQPAPPPQAQAISPVAPPPPAAPAPAAPAPLTFEPSIAAGEDDVASASDNAGPRAMAIVDLNSASVADLNGLKGGGMIGRAIVQKRPYTSVDQLLSKRVLSRGTYERIKDQVTVR
ncbi:ComEA family DNA-binding protein [Methylobacterium sp. J-090]|uniref:ComEA family DNA-binding protein n=1 Tax=Methylobacterium sp. J-090 TaxID=2836666 RepID=UPI001FBA1A57|nr:helix-hairpin-helix domain-containing protein [Methylobacterium sp. J-090]MCJ2081772.1 helix-hairpin-helix domain-containing protein [Methylobacterium sp. J-090]